MPERTLTVTIIGDDRDLKRAFASSEKAAVGFQGRVGTATAGLSRNFLAAGVAAGATAVTFQSVTAAIGASVSASSDLNEQISRTEIILGDSAEQTLKWSETTARAFGISQRAALAASATFAGLFQTVGVNQEKAGQLSRSLVQLAADLASLQNSSPEEALIALRSGLAGEAEPLRRFNIFLSETRVQMEAMAASGKTNAAALTQQEKTLARYNLILQDSLPAQGNFNATSGELANQSRILRANLDDLSTDIGSILVPSLQAAAEAANLLFVALNRMRGVDFSPGFDFPDVPDWLQAGAIAPISPAGAVAVGIKRLLTDEDDQTKSATEKINESVTGTIADLVDALNKRANALRLAQDRDLRNASKAFAEFVKSMGLKLDMAGLTTSLSDDLAVLRELERAILRRIEAEGKTFVLVQSLTDVRLRINSVLGQQADAARQAGEDAFASMLDALDLKLESARATPSLADDQAALRAIEQRLLRRIESEGETTDLMRRLFNVRQEQADAARQLADQQRERRQEAQFKALGLTEEGDEKTPGAGSLLKRARNLQDQIKGTALDTNKNRQQLARIVSVLTKNYKTAGREVRSAILAMLNDISSALSGDDPAAKKGPLTKGSGLNTKKILEGLGLSADEINALRGRLSSINSAGLQLPPGASSVGSKTTSGRPFDSGLTIDNYVTVEIDGVKVTSTVTKQQQKQRRRNPKQKRGPNRMTGGV